MGAAPRVGRRNQLGWLEQRLDDALEGRPQLVLLTGDAGIGKSRLLRELQHTAARRGADVCPCRCRQNLDLPYLPFANSLLPRLERITGGDPDLRSYAAVIGRLLGRGEGATSTAPELDDSDPARERTLLLVAVAWATMRLAHSRPLVLAVEDLQWVDEPSLDLFCHVVVEIADAALHSATPVMVVTTYRPDLPARVGDELARLRREEICQELELHPLSSMGTGELLRALGLPNPSRQLTERVHGSTGGNPLLVEHALRTLETEPPPRAQTEVAAVPGPVRSELEDTVAARLAQLSEPTQTALEVASFFGRGFSVEEIAAVTGASAASIAEQLDEAVAEGVLMLDQGRFQFVQPLHARVAYATPGPARRRRLHLEIAETLRQLPGGERRELEIAHHLMEAGDTADPARVLDHTRRAGELARGMLAWGEAARCYSAAVVAAEQLDEPDGTLGDLHLQAGIAHYRNMDGDLSRAHSEQAAACYRAAGDQRSLVLALLELTKTQIILGSFGTAVDLEPLENALASLGDDEPGLRARILADMSAALWVRGDLDRGRDLGERAAALGEQSGDHSACTRALVSLGMIHWLKLELREALLRLEAALEHARAVADPWEIGLPLCRIALTQLWLGDLDAADATARDANEHGSRVGDAAERSLALAALIGVAVVRGDFAEAERLVDEAWMAARLSRYGWSISIFLPTITSARVAQGAFGPAGEAVERIVEPDARDARGLYDELALIARLYVQAHAGDHDEVASWVRGAARARWPLSVGSVQRSAALAEMADLTGSEIDLDRVDQTLAGADDRGMIVVDGLTFLLPRVRGLVARLRGDDDAAEAHLRRAIGLAEAMGARPELGRSRLELARALSSRATDDAIEEARSLAKGARTVFHELRMDGFEEQARRLATAGEEGDEADVEGPEGTAVILFTDIVGSTALTEEFGDAAYRSRAQALDVALRAAVADCGGEAVEGITLGDGVLATFRSARGALECAERAHARARSNAFALHVGLHAGDVLRSRTGVHGGAVNIAARVCEQAPPGETLVSETVRGLARTSADVTFEDRGVRELKGVGEPMRLFAVVAPAPPA